MKNIAESVPFSSEVNEGIRAVLFLLQKDFSCTKNTKTHESEQKQKKAAFLCA